MLLGNLSNHADDGKQKPHKFAYLTMKNSIFSRFVFFYTLKTFSFFLRREIRVNNSGEMICFAVVWTTWAYDKNDKKCSILSSYAPSACPNLIPGQLEHIFKHNDFG